MGIWDNFIDQFLDFGPLFWNKPTDPPISRKFQIVSHSYHTQLMVSFSSPKHTVYSNIIYIYDYIYMIVYVYDITSIFHQNSHRYRLDPHQIQWGSTFFGPLRSLGSPGPCTTTVLPTTEPSLLAWPVLSVDLGAGFRDSWTNTYENIGSDDLMIWWSDDDHFKMLLSLLV
jgi:hypothetical protein